MTLFEERHGLPSFGRTNRPEKPEITFESELIELGAYPDIGRDFLATIEAFSPHPQLRPEFSNLLKFGSDYHRLPWDEAFNRARLRTTKEVGVFVPSTEQTKEIEYTASLLGFVGFSGLSEDLNPVLYGVVVLRDKKVRKDNALLVTIDTGTGKMQFLSPTVLQEGPLERTPIYDIVPQQKPAA